MSYVFGGLLSLSAPLIIIAAVVAGIVFLRGQHEHNAFDPGIGTIRRLFLYGVALIAAIFAAVGAGLVIDVIAESVFGDRLAGDNSSTLALGAAFLIVGAPAWVATWIAIRRVAERYPIERRTTMRRFYLSLVRAIGLTVVLVGSIEAGLQLIGEDDFDATPWGIGASWLLVWLLHDLIARREPIGTDAGQSLDRLYRIFIATLSLAVLAVGLGSALSSVFDRIYVAAFDGESIARASLWVQVREPLVPAVAGAALWGWMWARRPGADADTTLWLVYVFVAGILASALAAVTAGALLLHSVLQWYVGEPDSESAFTHFGDAPAWIAALLTALAVWGYHRAAQREHSGRAGRLRSEPERVYRYTLAAVGLGAVAIGVLMLVAGAIDIALPEERGITRAGNWWRNPLIVAVTLIAVGGPLWIRHWRDAQRHAPREPERESGSRRAYIFGIFGVSALAALIALVVVIYQVLDGLLDSSLDAQTFRQVRYALAVVATAGATGLYHWLVLREDQSSSASAALRDLRPGMIRPDPVDLLIVAPGDARAIAAALGTRLRAQVRVERRVDQSDIAPTLGADAIEEIALAVLDGTTRRAMVVVDADGEVTVVPLGPRS